MTTTIYGLCFFLCHHRGILSPILPRYFRIGVKFSLHQISPFQVSHVPGGHTSLPQTPNKPLTNGPSLPPNRRKWFGQVVGMTAPGPGRVGRDVLDGK